MSLCKEQYHGNVEYKRLIMPSTNKRLHELMSQLKYRLSTGYAIYKIGIEDDGSCSCLSRKDLDKSIETLQDMCNKLDATIDSISYKYINGNEYVQVKILRKLTKKYDCYDVEPKKEIMNTSNNVEKRVAFVGNVDSGKSTLIGVISQNILDNGRGLARLHSFRYIHEHKTGRTSSISHIPVNTSPNNLVLIDLAGHEKYLKTTIYGLSSLCIDYVVIVIAANMGIRKMTKEHMNIVMALKLKVIIAITKIDLVDSTFTDNIIKTLKKHMAPMYIKKETEPIIFTMSNKTGQGINVFRDYLNGIKSSYDFNPQNPIKMKLERAYNINGVGVVVSGLLCDGIVEKGKTYQIGPDRNGQYFKIVIRSLEINHVKHDKVVAGHTVAFSFRSQNKTDFMFKRLRYNGLTMRDINFKANTVKDFNALVMVANHPCTIRKGFQTTIFIDNIKCHAKVIAVYEHNNNESLSEPISLGVKDIAKIHFQIMLCPMLIQINQRFVFSEGKVLGIGKVLELVNT